MELIIDRKKPIMATLNGLFGGVVLLQLIMTTIYQGFEIDRFLVLIPMATIFFLMMVQNFTYKEKVMVQEGKIRISKKLFMFPFHKEIALDTIKNVSSNSLKGDKREVSLEIKDKKDPYSLVYDIDKNKAQKLVTYLNKQLKKR
ncbi:MAG: hypothetical protein GY827_12425 [Cytophagales bacterium]|nr:hypothetical protein [Cytophagales bacterium]